MSNVAHVDGDLRVAGVGYGALVAFEARLSVCEEMIKSSILASEARSHVAFLDTKC